MTSRNTTKKPRSSIKKIKKRQHWSNRKLRGPGLRKNISKTSRKRLLSRLRIKDWRRKQAKRPSRKWRLRPSLTGRNCSSSKRLRNKNSRNFDRPKKLRKRGT